MFSKFSIHQGISIHIYHEHFIPRHLKNKICCLYILSYPSLPKQVLSVVPGFRKNIFHSVQKEMFHYIYIDIVSWLNNKTKKSEVVFQDFVSTMYCEAKDLLCRHKKTHTKGVQSTCSDAGFINMSSNCKFLLTYSWIGPHENCFHPIFLLW